MTTDEAWRTLKLSPPVTEAGLKAAYRGLAKQFHPDRYASFDRQVWAAERFIRVKVAYDLLRKLEEIPPTGSNAPLSSQESPGGASRGTSVFDHYADQSEFTERDFIAWLSLWRFGLALFRKVTSPWAGADIVQSPQFQAALGCGMLIALVPVSFLLFPVAMLLLFSFAIYLLLQKVFLKFIEQIGGTRIGPDSPRLSGQVLYLGLLCVGAGGAIQAARYLLSLEANREWVTTSLVWGFAGTLALTWLLETMLFLRARWLRSKLGADPDAALALPP